MSIKLDKIQVIPFCVASGPHQMAIDQWMLENTGHYLRLYQWKGPTLSIGRNQVLGAAINQQFCRSNQIEIVRRSTGGQAVLHHQELTYSFASSIPPFQRSILESYQWVRQPILNALLNLGVPVEAGMGGKFKPSGSVCFSSVLAHEVTLDSRKLVGSAQRRKGGRLLQHGSILLGYDLTLLQGIWPDLDPQKWSDEVITLNHLRDKIDVTQLGTAIIQAFQEHSKAQIESKYWGQAEQDWIAGREQGFLLP